MLVVAPLRRFSDGLASGKLLNVSGLVLTLIAKDIEAVPQKLLKALRAFAKLN